MNKKITCSALSLFLLTTTLLLAEKPYTTVGRDPENSNIHGHVDVTCKNDYITPRGLLNTKNDLTTQVLAELLIDVYKDPTSLITDVSLTGFVWNDLWSGQHNSKVGSWNELDWGIGANCTIAQNTRFGVQYIEFLSPPGNFKAEHNVEFSLLYDDTHLQMPISIKPYVKWFWAVSGDSTVVTGKRGKTFDIEIGMTPTLDLQKHDMPVILTVPTWITVGPASFWNGGKQGLKHENSNLGVFSTGLRAEIPLDYIPKSLGSWYIDAGIQYYHLINDNLLQAQMITLDKASRKSAHRNIAVYSAGIGFRF